MAGVGTLGALTRSLPHPRPPPLPATQATASPAPGARTPEPASAHLCRPLGEAGALVSQRLPQPLQSRASEAQGGAAQIEEARNLGPPPRGPSPGTCGRSCPGSAQARAAAKGKAVLVGVLR